MVEIPGFPQAIDDSGSRMQRFGYRFLLVAALVITIGFCVYNIYNFFDRKTANVQATIQEESMYFPHITICSPIPFAIDKLLADGFREDLVRDILKSTQYEVYDNVPASNLSQSAKQAYIFNFSGGDINSFYIKYGGMNCEMISHCEYNRHSFNCCDPDISAPFLDWEHGTCQVFFMKERQKYPGDRFRLLLKHPVLAEKTLAKYSPGEPSLGFHMTIDQNYVTIPANVFYLNPGLYTTYELSLNKLRKKNGMFVKCSEQSYFGESNRHCMEAQCANFFEAGTCHCQAQGFLVGTPYCANISHNFGLTATCLPLLTDTMSSPRKGFTTLCDPIKRYECNSLMNYTSYDSYTLYQTNCQPHCATSFCEEWDYRVTTIIKPLNLQWYFGQNASELNIQEYVGMSIGYPNFGYVLEEIKDAQSIDELISLLGGQMGLWLGCSLISFVQLCQWTFKKILGHPCQSEGKTLANLELGKLDGKRKRQSIECWF